MVSVHSSKTLRHKLVQGTGYYCDRPDPAFVWKNVDMGTWDLNSDLHACLLNTWTKDVVHQAWFQVFLHLELALSQSGLEL